MFVGGSNNRIKKVPAVSGRRVGFVLSARKPPPSLTWLKMIARIDNDTMICTMFR